MMMWESSLVCVHVTESNLEGFIDFKIQSHSEMNIKLWIIIFIRYLI